MQLNSKRAAEIQDSRTESESTRRAVSPKLEEILFEPIPVLDHGFIRVIDYMGNDSAIVQAARVSYGKGTKQISADRGLIRYLLRHRHTTPFEMCEIKFHVKLPIFVARQWIRHRTANVNEYSARFSILDKEFYFPDIGYLKELFEEEKIKKREKAKSTPDLFGPSKYNDEPAVIAPQSESNKQGREGYLNEEEAVDSIKKIKKISTSAYNTYEKLLNETSTGRKIDSHKQGLARELARMVLPTNVYTQWYWKIDLHNFLHFLSLRADPHAQYEIRAYADVMLDILKRWVPLTHEAFMDYAMGGARLSAAGLAIVKRILAGEDVTQAESGLSKREWRELMALLGREE